jgi:cytochrome c biogenesis protein CcdA
MSSTTGVARPGKDLDGATSTGSWTERVGGHVRSTLRAEGLPLFIAGAAAYGALGGPWLAFIPLLIVPDASAIGFVRDARLGAATYNLAHNLVTAGAVLGLGLSLGIGWLTIVGTVLLAHIGMDRVAGYGLKYPTTFKDTHFQHV